jgi:hypothetical protein
MFKKYLGIRVFICLQYLGFSGSLGYFECHKIGRPCSCSNMRLYSVANSRDKLPLQVNC